MVEDETYNNIVIMQGWFRNAGEAPILPTDYHKNLSVSVTEPWKIVAVENRYLGTNLGLEWKRISDTRFEAEPALINPGDRFDVSVYLSNTAISGPYTPEKASEPKVEWDARITNLRGFTKPGDILDQMQREVAAFPAVRVYLVGWGLLFTVVGALLWQTLYLHLLHNSGLLREWRWTTIVFVAFTSLLSFAAAESVATYWFKNVVNYYGVEHWLNLPPIILSALFLAFLWWRLRPRSEKNPLEAG